MGRGIGTALISGLAKVTALVGLLSMVDLVSDLSSISEVIMFVLDWWHVCQAGYICAGGCDWCCWSYPGWWYFACIF